ncbi:hypothetical protein ES702_02595 [subsurface metagenome]
MTPQIFITNADDEKVPSSFFTQEPVPDVSQHSTARKHSRFGRYVPNGSLHLTTFAERHTDNDLKVFPELKDHSTAPSLDRPREPNSVDSSLFQHPLRKCLHGTSLTNLNIAGVETLDDKDVPVDHSDKQFQINFHQTIKSKQREDSGSHIIRLRLRKPILQVIKVQPEVIVAPRKAHQIHELISKPFVKTVTPFQNNDMNDIALTRSGPQHEDLDGALGLGIATTEVVANSLAKSITPDNDFEWSLVHNKRIDTSDSLESPLSILSPLSPFTDTEELISSYHCAERLCRRLSSISDDSTEGLSLPVVTKKSSAEIIVNGKPHAHPLRSNPVTENDYITLPETPACLFPPRTDSLQSSTISSKGSISDAVSPRTTRPPFPPRKDSLLPLNSFLNAQTERPRTSHGSHRLSRADLFSSSNKSELSLATPAQKAKLLHRRSASVADLFHSLTNKSANRSQSVAPQVSAPILIQAPAKPPATAPVPSKVQPPVYQVTPYTMQPPFRSQTWNMSQLSTQSSANTSNISNDVSLTHSASQTSLHSNNANRRAFVMQRANTSVFSLHSQNSTQDLNGMLSGYDTHPNRNETISPKTTSLAPPVPPKHEEIERLNRRGSETVRIPAPVPVDLKERRFRRVLNLRRANAVRHDYFHFEPSSVTAKNRHSNTHTSTITDVSFLLHSHQNRTQRKTKPTFTYKITPKSKPKSQSKTKTHTDILKHQAFTSTLNTGKANSPHPSPNSLSPVEEGGFRSRRTSIYAALAPSMIQIDVAGAAEVRRQSEFRGGIVGVRRR